MGKQKSKVSPAAIALVVILALVFVGITAKVLTDRFAPSSVTTDLDELEKKLDNIKKSPK
ncbi:MULTISPECIES: hypothetical protein [Pseudanabaena]|jgi:hypothetical protein|uniref:hypothetical protein n=1 Tax=Pseudanabaena TaxID=1152 RepID=UPI00247AB68C|nr:MULTISPECIES: hypothetical protein [Pseudanabaena]MEA5487093.1 hypothetical protein [Pseudanabaena sp. CCNP1317]WGS74837.1 hypothetical protein OA858_22845 [Pseudanabaena galeata CCNP1313]